MQRHEVSATYETDASYLSMTDGIKKGLNKRRDLFYALIFPFEEASMLIF